MTSHNIDIKKTGPLSIFIVTFLLWLASPVLPAAQDFPSEPTGHVNDFANMLSRSEMETLEMKLRNYRDTTTNVITIATLTDLQNYPIEEVSMNMFNEWQMWHEDRYNGILILIAQQERKMRIEVGYGLEGAVPDVMAGRIIRQILTPAFKQGAFYEGLDRATSALIQLSEGEYEGSLSRQSSDGGEGMTDFVIFILFVLFAIYVSSRRGGGKGGRRRRSIGPGGIILLGGGFGSGRGGGGSGGFGGFSGGGGFGAGGGGASGGW